MSKYRIVGAPIDPPTLEFDGDAHTARRSFEALYPGWRAATVQVLTSYDDADPEALDWETAEAVCESCGLPGIDTEAWARATDDDGVLCPACEKRVRGWEPEPV